MLRHRITRFALLLLTLLTIGWGRASSASAETDDERVFVRVRSVDDIEAGGRFIVGAFEREPNGTDLYWMSGKGVSKNTKLGSVKDIYKETAPDTLIKENDALLWEFIEEESGDFAIRNFATQTWIFANKKGETNISLNESKKTEWVLSEKGGYFNLQNAADEGYYIGLSKYTTVYFGNYKDPDAKDLIIYKERQKIAVEQSTWPTDGASVALCSRSMMADSRLQPQRMEGYLLQNGTLANDDAVGRWTFEAAADSCFTLRTAGGKWLTYSLTEGDNAAMWQIVGGRIATTEVTPRCLCLVGEAFSLLSLEEAEYAHNAVLKVVGEEPTWETIGGIMTLRGAWSRDRLAAVEWGSADRLDLTAVSLPRSLAAFAARPVNSIVYVSQTGAAAVPEDWEFTVMRAADADTLLTRATIKDGTALHVDCPIVMTENGMATYERNAYGDGLWETLSVPFAAALPSAFSGETLAAATATELTFEPTDVAAANVPLIVRYTGTATTDRPLLRLTADTGTLSTTTAFGSSVFSGTYEPLTVDASAGNVYLLNAEGTAFVRAAEGSSLSPFRAGIVLSAESKSIRISHARPTAVAGISTYEETNDKSAYAVDGRRVKRAADGLPLPRGLYIVGGKKVVVR